VFDGCRGGNDLIATCHCHCHNFQPSPSPSPSLSGLLIFLTRQISYHNEGNKPYSPTPSRVHRLPSNRKSPMCGGCQEVTVLHRRRYYSVRRTMYSCVTPSFILVGRHPTSPGRQDQLPRPTQTPVCKANADPDPIPRGLERSQISTTPYVHELISDVMNDKAIFGAKFPISQDSHIFSGSEAPLAIN